MKFRTHNVTPYTKSQTTRIRSMLHKQRIENELRIVGVKSVGLNSSEAKYLPDIIEYDEQIHGVVYGWQNESFVMLIATDRRVIFLDKKPFFTSQDDITYDVVSAISYSHIGIGSTIILHTRISDYKVRTFNQPAAAIFVNYIESRCLITHRVS